MPLLRMRSAAFATERACSGPVTLDLSPGQRAALAFGSPHEAAVVARLAAGIVKATTGCVLIGDYDPRVQSAHCKRIAAFVPNEPLELGELDFARYIAYRAALWNVDALQAIARAKALLEQLEGMHEAFAFPLIGALIATPQLVVLDRPAPAYAEQILDVAGTCALFSTHASP
ncbi:MAG: hypothetical protein WA814_04190, partial [Candidatus Baltobacteraceae bacterium]